MSDALKGLLAIPVSAKPKGKAGAGGEEPEDDAGGVEDEHIDDAYDAVKSGDKEAFREAFRSAVEACVARAKGGEYGDEPDEE